MLMFVRTVDFFCVCLLINTLNIFGALLHTFLFTRWAILLESLLLTCSAFVYCLKKENISDTYYSKKNFVHFDFIPLIH